MMLSLLSLPQITVTVIFSIGVGVPVCLRAIANKRRLVLMEASAANEGKCR